MKGRNAQVARIYRLLSILEGAPHGLTASDLLRRLGDSGYEVGIRTIYRDIEALQAAGFPLEERGISDDNGRRWTLARTTKISHYLVLSARELFALYLARMALTPLRDTPFFADLEQVFAKIEDKIAKDGREHIGELSQDLHIEPGPRWGLGIAADTVDTLRTACTERHIISMHYKSVNQTAATLRRVGPHFLYFSQGSLYLVAEDLKDQKIKIYSVPRIQDAAMTDEAYATEAVTPEQYFAHSFGIFRGDEATDVQLRFQPEVAPFVRERGWHASQRVINREGGCIDVHLHLALSPELVRWVLGFGAHVEVLQPSSLAHQVHEAASATAALYARGRQVS